MKNSHKHPFHAFHYCPQCGGNFREHNEKAYRCEQCGFVYYFQGKRTRNIHEDSIFLSS